MTPNNRALVEALKLHKAKIREVLPMNVRDHLDQFFGLAGKISWDDTLNPDGSLKIDPMHLKATHYSGRIRWLVRLTRWKGDSQAEYEEKVLQHEVLVCIDNTWYQEWLDVVSSLEYKEEEGNPPTEIKKDPTSRATLDPQSQAFKHAILASEPTLTTDDHSIPQEPFNKSR